MDRFHYESLDLADDAFRLIRVLPTRSDDSRLQLSLWHSIISSSSYYCLSYRWTSHLRRQSILLNGKSFLIGDNLHSFLEEMHRRAISGFDTPIWIDSICINQNHETERGHQVRNMGKIYGTAKEVMVWLGIEVTMSDTLRGWLHSEDGSVCPEHLERQWEEIRYSSYWCRAWIVQEILLAKALTIVFPGASIDWTIIGNAIAKSGDLTRFTEETAAQIWTAWSDRWRTGQKSSACEVLYTNSPDYRGIYEEFWTLMYVHQRARCTDPRDRIYSLLGLVDRGQGLTVDYNESVEDLFWRAGEYFGAWDSPELVDVLRTALFQEDGNEDDCPNSQSAKGLNPWRLVESLRSKPDLDLLIPVRRASPTTSFLSRLTRRIKCNFSDCSNAFYFGCTRGDILLCTNARSDGPTEHGCIHGLAHPLDNPAAEPFEVKLVAHHGHKRVITSLHSTALKAYDRGTEQWIGVSTWSKLEAVLYTKGLDREDLVKLAILAKYAVWIWFGVHPDHFDARHVEHVDFPSPHHALPPGTRITRDAIEVPAP
ncbi:hypothetical protein T440DRAFT_525137 [Plenodomus tracheiphilus IPT5]|uniref:Heterokaryon incompatibility domain-containing protein n=1 Tax=Plenodomus tracheiphilus IPT5 TaxID=1408161 RepID=A0A6A7BB59_9PLEO|nr:hypothetical protein T440DRAFT_525137 [Plenodomus tracheiphilus IPT5]